MIYMNGFEWNNWTENIFKYYFQGSYSGISTESPYTGNYSLKLGGSFGWTFDEYVSLKFAPKSEFYFQFLIMPTQINFGSESAFLHLQYDNTSYVRVTMSGADHKLRVYNGNKTVLYCTSTASLTLGIFHLVELYCNFAVSGDIEVRLNGVSTASYSGDLSAASSGINILTFTNGTFAGESSNCEMASYIDDVVVNDTTGGVNDSWPNGLRVLRLNPIGKGSSFDWIKSSTTNLDNYWCVDNNPVSDPSEYLYTNLDVQTDLYRVMNLPDTAYQVAAVRVDAWALKNSGSPQRLAVGVHPAGSTTTFSSDMDLSVSYQLISNLWDTNPDTLSAWTVGDVNDIEVGMISKFP
jgi:hypothetical protein